MAHKPLSALIGTDLSYEIYKKHLNQSYEEFIQRNSSEMITVSTVHILATVMQ